MALIESLKNPAPKDSLQASLKMGLVDTINSTFQQMLTLYITGMASVWQNQVLSPQEAFDAFGTDAAELDRLAQIIKEAINRAVPGTITTPAPKYTINPDGTIKVG